MSKAIPIRTAAFLALTATLSLSAQAAPFRIGNGDDGSDLEGAIPLKEGKIVDARSKATALLRRLSVEGIGGMGMVIPEVERSPLYFSKRDSATKLSTDQGIYHADMRGLVFARTLPEPHAATRFFPVAEKLDDDQLVALHIHEALHRALPASVRENESIVSEITLAIVSPEASNDQVRQTVVRLIPEQDRIVLTSASAAPALQSEAVAAPAPTGSLAAEPSLMGYEFRTYSQNEVLSSRSSVSSMHLLQSYLHPFGNNRSSIGIGIEASLINQPTGTVMGPLGLSGRMRLWSGRGFDVGGWANLALNMLSAEELKNSRFGRDVMTIGLSMRKDLSFFYVENFLSLSPGGEAATKYGRIDIKYEYGSIVNAQVHTGATIGIVKAGGYAEIFLADYMRTTAGTFVDDTGRYRLISAGPEVTVRSGNLALTAYGKFLLNAPENVDFDSLGNLMGPGSGQGSVGARMSVHF